MTRFTDRDLEDILHSHDDPTPEPPEDLAERIKAEIPDDLEGLFADSGEDPDDESEADGRILPFPSATTRRGLALAALLVFAVGLTFLMRPWEAPSEETTTSDGLAGTPATEDVEGRTENDGDPSTAGETASESSPTDADGADEAKELRKKREALRRQLEAIDHEEGDSAPPPQAGREPRREPMPDPTPEAPPPDQSGERARLEEKIQALGYVDGTGRVESEASPPPAPPMPPPPPHPSPSAASSLAGAVQKASPAAEPSRNPNDAPYDHVYFESAGVNPFVDTEDDRLSTFGLDVDTASYTVVRRHLRDGHLPPKDAVRVEEMVNFFDYGDAPPEESDFALHAEGAPSPWGEGERYYLLRFGIRARDVVETERPPATLVFVVDVSGSMDRENRLGLVKDGLGLLLEHLREDDRVGLVVYGSRGEVLLEPTGDHAEVRRAIDRLAPGGSTNAAEGLRLGYELAARHKERGRIHRVILCSDGVANVGSTTSSEGILGEVERWARQGIELTTVGFGMGNYNDVLMERLADDGNGRYAYVDTLGEARRLFVEDLTGTLVTVAAEARAQVAFDPEVVSRYRLLGYENRDIADERFRDDTVDAGEIGAGHTVTAVYEIKTREPLRRRDEIATLTLRYASIEKGEMVEQSSTIRGKDIAESFEDAPASLRLAALVAETAEILRGSYWAREGDLDEVFRRAQAVSAEFPGDADVAEFAALVGRAAKIRGREHQSRE